MQRARLFSWQLYTHQNYGDALLAEAIRYLFHSFGQRQCFRIENGADNRYTVGPRMIELANRYDAGIIAGGGLILPRNEKLSGWAFKSSVKNARLLRKTIIFALGYNLYHRHDGLPPIFKEHFEAILENSPFVGLRNHGSIEKVKEIVDPRFHERIVFQPCPTTFVRQLVDEIDPVNRPELGRRATLQISLFGASQFGSKIDDDRFCSEVLKACCQLKARGYELEIASFFAKFDTPIVGYLRTNGFAEFDFIEMNTEGADMLLGPRHFSKVPIVVSTRGHGTMVPFGAGSTIVPLNTSPKIEYFAEECNIGDLLIEVDDPDLAGSIVRNVERCHDEYEHIQTRLEEQRQRFYEVSLDNLSRIYFLLTGVMPTERTCMPLNEFEVFLSSRLHSKSVKLEGITRGKAG